MREFHISRYARELYQFDDSLFSLTGNVIFANFHVARLFAQRINQKRDLFKDPGQVIQASHINAMGLIDEILHYIVELYRQQISSNVLSLALEYLYQRLGKDSVNQALLQFCEQFPIAAVYRNKLAAKEYIEGSTLGIPNRLIVLEEMLLLWLANVNPAFSPFSILFDDEALKKETIYLQVIDGLIDFFKEHPKFGPDQQSLVEMLRSPAIAEPNSLEGQLEYIRNRWGYLLGKYLWQLLSSLDFLHEEEKAMFLGVGPALVYEYAGQEHELERFSPDTDWMPSLVLMAKNTYVWLDQLSKRYKRPIVQLDQIPDEELETLARWGFSGLWLIGIWERSRASKRIKQMRGNPEAIGSAYSIYEYKIAEELGGEAALSNLRQRAWRYGIRLASDMVPNHMAIDSKWVIEHPNWFLSLDYCPYPSYSFNGPNLSGLEDIEIYLEDHYYDGTDAAVVFKRMDLRNGEVRYIYHGNDGTSMPWNDTAQLNYLLPEVREAVMQTILDVARRFPIIRFDAAMTLTKRHYQRLWFPEPGSGGAIPTRAEHGMTKEEFNAAMPNEFWREVVDRIAQEAPDTLLLAEAFWLMEGYFVRTLGMHRVYNSAFMNMLRDERNHEYRLVIKNTLEFDPQILKRFVNFMNNPDERTAVEQFGKGDKYFGICTMMVTLPGLPMFGHGQIEGFAEKYGMEYCRAYWDEQPDKELIQRHERQIFPLLRRRYLFAEVEHFRLYDFVITDGYINEDVFAYSNRFGSEKVLVIYHNRYAETKGWIRSSVGYLEKRDGIDERLIVQKKLAEELGLHRDSNYYALFCDHITGLEYIRNSLEIHDQGLYIELGAYQCNVFLDFREVQDDEQHHYRQLHDILRGQGTLDIENSLKELILQPVHGPFRELFNASLFHALLDAKEKDLTLDAPLMKDVHLKIKRFIWALAEYSHVITDEFTVDEIANRICKKVLVILRLMDLLEHHWLHRSRDYASAMKFIKNFNISKGGNYGVKSVLLSWVFVHLMGEIVQDEEATLRSRIWMDELLLSRIIAETLRDMGMEESSVSKGVMIVKIFTLHRNYCKGKKAREMCLSNILEDLLKDEDVRSFMQVHRFQDVLWFNKEAFEELTQWMFIISTIHVLSDESLESEQITQSILHCYRLIKALDKAKQQSSYQVDKLFEAVKGR